MTGFYKLELHNGMIPRTEWMARDSTVPASVWWLTGTSKKGNVFMSRPATDIEVEFWQRILALELTGLDNQSASDRKQGGK